VFTLRFQLRQLSKQFADAFTSPLKFLKFRGSGITLFKEFRPPIYLDKVLGANLLQAQLLGVRGKTAEIY
jgi:hypothetical protein